MYNGVYETIQNLISAQNFIVFSYLNSNMNLVYALNTVIDMFSSVLETFPFVVYILFTDLPEEGLLHLIELKFAQESNFIQHMNVTHS